MADPNVIAPEDVQFSDAPSQQDVVVHGNDEPNLERHDPSTFAGLTTQRAIPILYQQSGQPSGETVQRIFEKALDTANDYQKSKLQAGIELQKRQEAVTSGLTTAEETAKANVDIAKQKVLEQFRQGPDAAAAAAANAQKGESGEVVALPDDISKRIITLNDTYKNLNDLQNLHTKMVETTPGTGGVLKTAITALFTQPGLTSQAARNFFAAQDASLTPLAMGVLGDTAGKAGQPSMQELMKGILPDKTDNIEQAGNKIYMMKKRMIDELQAMHDVYKGKYPTAAIDAKLADLSGDFNSSGVQRWNPYDARNTDMVQVGNSPEGKAQIATAVTGKPAGPNTVGAAAQLPSVWSPNPAPTAVPRQAQPYPSPNALAVSQQQAEQFKAGGTPSSPASAFPNPIPVQQQFGWLWNFLNQQSSPGAGGILPQHQELGPPRDLSGVP